MFNECQAPYTCHSEQGAGHHIGSLRHTTGIGVIHVKALNQTRHALNVDADEKLSFGAGFTAASICPSAFVIIIKSKWSNCTNWGHCATPAECAAACYHATGTYLLVLLVMRLPY